MAQPTQRHDFGERQGPHRIPHRSRMGRNERARACSLARGAQLERRTHARREHRLLAGQELAAADSAQPTHRPKAREQHRSGQRAEHRQRSACEQRRYDRPGDGARHDEADACGA